MTTGAFLAFVAYSESGPDAFLKLDFCHSFIISSPGRTRSLSLIAIVLWMRDSQLTTDLAWPVWRGALCDGWQRQSGRVKAA